MSSNLPRRQFLHTGAAVLTGWALPSWIRAADPIVRNGKPHLKLSLAAYSFNRHLPQNWPSPKQKDATMTLLDFIDFCAEQNLDGTELTSYYFPAEVTPDYIRQIKEQTFRLGLDISGTAIGNDFCKPAGAALDAEKAMTRKWIDYASELGAPVIRIFAGHVPKGDTEAAALDRCVAAIDEAVAYAATKSVVLALENHGGITSTPEQLLAIVQRVAPSPSFGVNFDSGNFRTADPYQSLEMIAPYAMNAQVKVTVSPNGGKKEEADLARIIGMLKQTNYRGYVVLEYEEDEEPRTAIPPLLKKLRGLIAG